VSTHTFQQSFQTTICAEQIIGNNLADIIEKRIAGADDASDCRRGQPDRR